MKQAIKDRIIIGAFVILLVCLFLFIRTIFITPHVDHNDFCRWEHGEDWVYEYSEHFGRTCIELDFVSLGTLDRAIIDKSSEEIYYKYCEDVGLFELSKWDNRCGK